MTTRPLFAAALGVVLAFGARCGNSGPKLYPVTGTIKVDGKPAGDALVFLHRQGRDNPNEPVPYGKCGPDGTFTVTTSKEGDGAPPGEYVLTVVWPDMSKAPDGNGERPDLLRGTYSKAAQSALKATVEAKSNVLPEFTITAPKGTAPKETSAVKTDK